MASLTSRPGTRWRRCAGALAAVIVFSSPALPARAGEGAVDPPPDNSIVSGRRTLSPGELRAVDVTDLPAGKERLRALAAEGGSAVDLRRRLLRVYDFGNREVVVDAAARLTVHRGLDAAGNVAWEIEPLAQPLPVAARAGYVVPPRSAWVYNSDGAFTDIFKATTCQLFVNCWTRDAWRRDVIWTINAAWNYRCTGRSGQCQYFRIYGQMRAQAITGAKFPYNRAWLEFESNGQWAGSPSDSYEFHQPEVSIAGPHDATITVGFGTTFDVELGEAPLVISGGSSTKYEGSLSVSTEWWHPVSRPAVGSGGVQYCRYAAPWEAVRKVTTRVGIMQNRNAQLGGWHILFGMANKNDKCPSI
ncbi:MAG TPA: hypothetical protein VMP67_00160 [Candidatus Limnocylindria bacterium]|nr:hypothetical protein [Candidatus Limnocylindria bacterium]